MCKLLGSSKILARRHSQMVELSRYAAKALGSTQRDGFGFALKHQKGIYAEKYLNPESCKGMGIVPSDISKIPNSLKIAIKEGRDFSTSGTYPETENIEGCFISHGRTATCDKSVLNTHPFQGLDKNGGLWTIAHNGVVDCIGEKLETTTTCDSEHILNCFTKLDGVKSLKDQISGYAAILGINPSGEMVAFRDNSANLYVSMIEGYGIFTVSTDPNHCEEFNAIVCKHNRIKKSRITDSYLLEPYNYFTFHANGEITNVEFEPFPRYASNNQAVRTSLGSASYGTSYYGQSSKYPYPSYDAYSTDDLEDRDYAEFETVKKPDLSNHTPDIPGLLETTDFCEDPAILEAIDSGELSIRDLADMSGESNAPTSSFELLENRIANKLKRSNKFRRGRSNTDPNKLGNA